jgi:hypothetical protein
MKLRKISSWRRGAGAATVGTVAVATSRWRLAGSRLPGTAAISFDMRVRVVGQPITLTVTVPSNDPTEV